MIIPANSLVELARLSKDAAQDQDAKLQITTERNQVLCALAGDKKWLHAELAMQLIDANFPDWRAIVPKRTTTTAVVNAAELRKAFALAKLFARDNAFITRLTVEPQANTLTVQAVSADTGSAHDTLDADDRGSGPGHCVQCQLRCGVCCMMVLRLTLCARRSAQAHLT